jgi:hypothetical protein
MQESCVHGMVFAPHLLFGAGLLVLVCMWFLVWVSASAEQCILNTEIKFDI